MAEIFLAVERAVLGFERLVVIKRMLPHLAETPAFVEMFLKEARFIARITHPNIVQIHELGELDGTAYIAMEYVRARASATWWSGRCTPSASFRWASAWGWWRRPAPAPTRRTS